MSGFKHILPSAHGRLKTQAMEPYDLGAHLIQAFLHLHANIDESMGPLPSALAWLMRGCLGRSDYAETMQAAVSRGSEGPSDTQTRPLPLLGGSRISYYRTIDRSRPRCQLSVPVLPGDLLVSSGPKHSFLACLR